MFTKIKKRVEPREKKTQVPGPASAFHRWGLRVRRRERRDGRVPLLAVLPDRGPGTAKSLSQASSIRLVSGFSNANLGDY